MVASPCWRCVPLKRLAGGVVQARTGQVEAVSVFILKSFPDFGKEIAEEDGSEERALSHGTPGSADERRAAESR